MRKYRKSLWEGSLMSLVIPLLFGIFCGSMSCLFFSAVSYFLFRGMMFAGIFTILTLFICGSSAGWLRGKFRRRHGLFGGALCGGALYLILLLISLYFGESADIRKLLLFVAAGAIGGVSGVNSKRPGTDQ